MILEFKKNVGTFTSLVNLRIALSALVSGLFRLPSKPVRSVD